VAQLCLAWLLAQGDDLLPIPGTKRDRDGSRKISVRSTSR
jgi:aryl-alcohol dehydrogenase-like predicted oxidoreductase